MTSLALKIVVTAELRALLDRAVAWVADQPKPMREQLRAYARDEGKNE
ncbi:hypothetical protein [Defluviimonas salinarum]|uniref:Uncharacterized protein n=1 Tax=Defluviimonas salinarum TaxID=2992147 RepID=A0ABT3J6C4_9RHOB|nr:hypothetical protein [Defluviimonas salinarum]MCW3782949.1 hypothetical protein [Defluviimonas salinarum]